MRANQRQICDCSVPHFAINTRQAYIWTLITSCAWCSVLHALWVAIYGWDLQLHLQTDSITLRVALGLAVPFVVIVGRELIHLVSFRLAGVAKRDVALRWSRGSGSACDQLPAPLQIEHFRSGSCQV